MFMMMVLIVVFAVAGFTVFMVMVSVLAVAGFTVFVVMVLVLPHLIICRVKQFFFHVYPS